MNKTLPYRKAISLALITAPLFGLLGTAPLFEFSRMDLSRLVNGFVTTSGITLLIWLINICLQLLFSRFQFKGRDILRYAVSLVVCIFLLILLRQLLPMRLGQLPPRLNMPIPAELIERGFKPPRRILMPLLQILSINLVVLVLLDAILRATKQKIEAENTQLRMFNLEAKHSQLKQQLHPHFLFNSLSNLRSLIKRSPAQAEDYLEKLSRLLRLSIQSNLQTMVSVQEEIELTENYLDLQRLRFGEALQFFIEMPLDMKKFGKVPVYSIQLLVENAIKHNRITAGQPLKIHVTGDLIQRTITVENNFQPKPHLEEGSGVGLNNLKERYRLLNNDDIRVVRSPDKFIVTIKVWINESSDH
jgi:hypothetical protein